MIGFIDTYNQSESQSITVTHNQSSAHPFFLDCLGLSPFSFWFYDSLQLNYADSYILSARTTVRKHSFSIVAYVSVGVPK
jgi:hypothetical protein